MTFGTGDFYGQCNNCKYLFKEVPKETQAFLDAELEKEFEAGLITIPTERKKNCKS